MLASEILTLVYHLAEIDPVRQQVVQRAAPEDAATTMGAAGALPTTVQVLARELVP